MKLSAQLISTLSVATMTLGATPAFANETEAIAEPVVKPVFTTATQEYSRVTSRQVVREFNERLFMRPRTRSEGQEDTTGRILLRVRSTWRQPGLRNQNRHVLGLQRGGMFRNVTRVLQGDDRRRPVLIESTELPPALVITGKTTDRPTRRDIRGNRNLNDSNRR